MDASIDLSDPSRALDLNRIRYQLIRLEDTITYHLIERAQFPLNKTIYQPGAIDLQDDSAFSLGSLLSWPLSLFRKKDQPLSFMDWYLHEQEALQSRIRRFESPDEYPFFPDAVQRPILQPLDYPEILHPNDVVVNDRIKQYYVDTLLPAVCPDFGRGDRGERQENYGSSATCDIACLQALSRRIHFGKFVAESKFQSEREKFTALIKARDREGLGDAIVNKKVEQLVLQRLRRKVATYGQDVTAEGNNSGSSAGGADAADPISTKINVDAVVRLYEEFVIPVTKDVEVDYLLQRLDPPKEQPWYAALRQRKAPSTAETLLWGAGVVGGVAVAATAALRWLPRK